MLETVTPKQVARAIGVSESSLKRWCDRGLLSTVRTAGGHRRIPISSVVTFLRSTQHPVVKPELIGLPATCGKTEWVVARAKSQLAAALVEGDEGRCQQIVTDMWLAGQPIPVICDEVIAAAFRDIGELWSCKKADVYQERRACSIMLNILHELKMGTPPGSPECVATGGTVTGDQYQLPTSMVELVLQSSGWAARSLGTSVPFESMARAIRDVRPKIFWLSVSFIEDPAQFLDGFATLNAAADQVGSIIALGGFALTTAIKQKIRYSVACDSMQQLAEFATKFRCSAASSG
ncbi:MAG: helix-turn-helix domain-containing protein [Planctomycetaceae bacterium]|nr:MAG: helix-turn-helix domain-containing protein [Planctomycetaceae bacterium]